LNVNLAITVFRSDALTVDVTPPYWSYRWSVGEAIRKREPIANVDVPRGVLVDVSPWQIDAADIERIILERDGQIVVPILSTLRAKPMTTPLGVRKVLHSGSVLYPCSAFAPDADAVLTAIPDNGTNITKRFTAQELATIR
jgi:hypothetical protein